ncbi:MAG: polynucleotide kinase-phosphatase [Anaerolinea sp.]|nr:polynucleotide kinase-phosphatase [Anaerolinea sp.]
MKIELPELALVVLIGATGSGKSTFARAHFRSTEVISSDFCRGLVSDDDNDQTATNDAFDVLYFIAGKRLERGRLTVIDATNVKPQDRQPLLALARDYHVLPVAIVLNVPERACHEHNQARLDRDFGPHVVRNHVRTLRRSLPNLKREGFRRVFIFNSIEEVTAVSITRTPLWNNRQHEHGPFDIVGDIHGCADELELLLQKLGYERIEQTESPDPHALFFSPYLYRHPAGRKAIFLGDLVDRGPRSLDVIRLVRQMVAAGNALCVPGNHDVKLLRKLNGRHVRVNHGLEQTLAEIEMLPEEIREPFCRETADFLHSLVSHYVLDDGKLVVAHAGLKEKLQGRASGRVRDFALYGETTGETDEFGLPIRYNWAEAYRGRAMVVYGHTPVPAAEWLNHTINIDTGCVFGGKLTALRYPERELVSVAAARTYVEPVRPLHVPTSALSAQQEQDDLLDIADVIGKRIINTRLMANITIEAANSAAALEVMSRFAVNPKWLIYLPPTMSPTETSNEPDFLEHPAQAFAYYRHHGVTQVICEEKHMGSRAVVLVGHTATAVQRRFGVAENESGVIYTRTGRRFFDDLAVEAALLDHLRQALTRANFWDEFDTEWVCLDCELMPWSEKAQALLQQQYAAVGMAAQSALNEANGLWAQAARRGLDVTTLQAHYQARADMVAHYVQAYRQYCWPVRSVHDLKLAPFHILATEGAVHTDKSHLWHMETIGRMVARQPAETLMRTSYRVVNLQDDAEVETAVAWWQDLTGRGGEGMVVKPLDFTVIGLRGLVQPAIKCRGREYLRIIYGPEYTEPGNLTRLRQRSVGRKRSLALREFALGVEALERFVHREPLRRVHENVFGVLALESEPIDPRL